MNGFQSKPYFTMKTTKHTLQASQCGWSTKTKDSRVRDNELVGWRKPRRAGPSQAAPWDLKTQRLSQNAVNCEVFDQNGSLFTHYLITISIFHHFSITIPITFPLLLCPSVYRSTWSVPTPQKIRGPAENPRGSI